ncbi:MAG: hypothetical protein SF051_03630 [Elusimicrobiota bacterium]|nr:hypothetical protein [Elusimicrobiota bacterium]
MTRLAAAGLLVLLAGPAAAAGENEDSAALPSMTSRGSIHLFYQTTGPMSFVAMTPRDVPPDARRLGEVKSVSCQRGLSIPLAASLRATSVTNSYGDGGYAKAMEKMKKAHPDLEGIYDVKVDLEIFSILGGLYRSLCTHLTARGYAKP